MLYKHHLLFFLFLTITLSSAYASNTSSQQSLSLGVFPYVSPGQLVKFHTELKEIFEETLSRKVALVTAPDFKQFVIRTRQADYDFIMTAPHLGRLAEIRDGYRPIVHTMHEVQGIYLTNKTSGIHKLQDLKGKVLTLVGRTAIITQMVEQQLNKLGLYSGKDFTFRFTKTHNNAMFAPLRGESDASVTGTLLWKKIGAGKVGDQMRIIGKTPLSIGFQIMASKTVPHSDFIKLQKALLNFHKTPQGKAYMIKTGFKYFKKITPQAKKKLDPFVQIFLQKK